MAEFELVREEKVTLWKRYYVTVEAESLDEAVQIVSGENELGEDWSSAEVIEIRDSEDLDDGELVEVLPDSKEWSVEILDDFANSSRTGTILYTNVQKSSDLVSLFLYTSNYTGKSTIGISRFQPQDTEDHLNTTEAHIGSITRDKAIQFVNMVDQKHASGVYPDINKLRFLFKLFTTDATIDNA